MTVYSKLLADKELVPVNNERFRYADIIPSPGSEWITDGKKTTYVKRGPTDPFDELTITRIIGSKITYILDSRSDLSYTTSEGDVIVIGNVHERHGDAR